MRFRTLCLSILLSLLCAGRLPAQTQELQNGDILFQKLPCGSLCDAILATTPCEPGKRFNHCGIYYRDGLQGFVIEAIGDSVQRTPFERFASRDTLAAFAIGRPRYKNRREAQAAVAKAASYIGRPYDNPFLPGDSALYCSELVWESCLSGGKRLFSTAPMTFQTGGATHSAWAAYYQKLGVPIPEGLSGINPCALAASDRLQFFWMPKHHKARH